MDREKSTPVWSTTHASRLAGTHVLEMPLELKRLAGSSDTGDCSGFLNESRGATRRITSVEKEMRLMKELLDSMITKYDLLSKENKEMKNMFAKYDQIMETNKEMKKEEIYKADLSLDIHFPPKE